MTLDEPKENTGIDIPEDSMLFAIRHNGRVIITTMRIFNAELRDQTHGRFKILKSNIDSRIKEMLDNFADVKDDFS